MSTTPRPIDLGRYIQHALEAVQDHIYRGHPCPCCSAEWDGASMEHAPGICDYIATLDALSSVDDARYPSTTADDVSALLTTALARAESGIVVDLNEGFDVLDGLRADLDGTYAELERTRVERDQLRATCDELTTVLDERVDEVEALKRVDSARRRMIADLQNEKRKHEYAAANHRGVRTDLEARVLELRDIITARDQRVSELLDERALMWGTLADEVVEPDRVDD